MRVCVCVCLCVCEREREKERERQRLFEKQSVRGVQMFTSCEDREEKRNHSNRIGVLTRISRFRGYPQSLPNRRHMPPVLFLNGKIAFAPKESVIQQARSITRAFGAGRTDSSIAAMRRQLWGGSDGRKWRDMNYVSHGNGIDDSVARIPH